jgi:citrate synthase
VAAGGGDLGTVLLAASSASRAEEIGRAAEEVFEFLDEIECEADVETLLDRLTAGELKLPGVVPVERGEDDPRAEILSGYCLSLADDREQAGFERLVAQIEQAAPDSKLTVAWPLARIFHYLGLEHELIAPLLTIARFPAWTAHYLEQFGHLLNCGWRYIGPEFRLEEGEDSQL